MSQQCRLHWAYLLVRALIDMSLAELIGNNISLSFFGTYSYLMIAIALLGFKQSFDNKE